MHLDNYSIKKVDIISKSKKLIQAQQSYKAIFQLTLKFKHKKGKLLKLLLIKLDQGKQ